jgi:hypothetical protein
MTTSDGDEKTVFYKLICRQCDGEGYQISSRKLPIESGNIVNPNSSEPVEYEILPSDSKGYIRIKQKCIWCRGLKYNTFCSDGWKLEIIEPKKEISDNE